MEVHEANRCLRTFRCMQEGLSGSSKILSHLHFLRLAYFWNLFHVWVVLVSLKSGGKKENKPHRSFAVGSIMMTPSCPSWSTVMFMPYLHFCGLLKLLSEDGKEFKESSFWKYSRTLPTEDFFFWTFPQVAWIFLESCSNWRLFLCKPPSFFFFFQHFRPAFNMKVLPPCSVSSLINLLHFWSCFDTSFSGDPNQC